MSYTKEARLTLVGDELRAVEATGVGFQEFALTALRVAVDELMASQLDKPVEEEPEPEEALAEEAPSKEEVEEAVATAPMTAAQKEASESTGE